MIMKHWNLRYISLGNGYLLCDSIFSIFPISSYLMNMFMHITGSAFFIFFYSGELLSLARDK